MNCTISTLAWAALGAVLLPASLMGAGLHKPLPGGQRQMATIDSYLMPRADEMRLARSAAPPAVSDHATVLVLTGHGYVTAAQGSNGFVCFVERSWDSSFGAPTFWDPHIRGANCVNPPAARSVLPYFLLRTQLALAGRSQAEILAGLKGAVAAHRLPQLEPNAVSFMLSKNSYLTASGGNLAHVMFYVPSATPGELGAGLPGSPLDVAGHLDAAPITIVVVATGRWSDGTADRTAAGAS